MTFICKCKARFEHAENPFTISDISRHLRDQHNVFRLPATLAWQTWKARAK